MTQTPPMTPPMMQATEHKSFTAPEETRSFERGQVELVTVGGAEIGRLTLQPGWRWSDHVKPIAGTDLCEAPHFQYHVSGRLGVRMADGTELELRAGERLPVVGHGAEHARAHDRQPDRDAGHADPGHHA